MADGSGTTARICSNGKHVEFVENGTHKHSSVESQKLASTKNGLPPLTIPDSGSSVDTLQDSQRTPTEEVGAPAQLVLPQTSAPQTPTKPVNHYPSWKRGSTGSPYNVQVGSTTPSPAGRTVER